MLRNLGRTRTAILTGWAVNPNCRYRYQCDAAFPLSDHADFPDLIELVKRVQPKMEELKADFPDGLDYKIAYDPTVFVRHSIKAVVHTLLEAIVLVVLVVILFLQTWRASIIPLVAVPVSLVGTFAVMLALGFSINALSLFGLVLAIGIVVDELGLELGAVTRRAVVAGARGQRGHADDSTDSEHHREQGELLHATDSFRVVVDVRASQADIP